MEIETRQDDPFPMGMLMRFMQAQEALPIGARLSREGIGGTGDDDWVIVGHAMVPATVDSWRGYAEDNTEGQYLLVFTTYPDGSHFATHTWSFAEAEYHASSKSRIERPS